MLVLIFFLNPLPFSLKHHMDEYSFHCLEFLLVFSYHLIKYYAKFLRQRSNFSCFSHMIFNNTFNGHAVYFNEMIIKYPSKKKT